MLLGLESTPMEQWMADPRAVATAIRHLEEIDARTRQGRR